jgi:hypothetical protein
MTVELDSRLVNALHERGHENYDLLSANEMFEEYCNWHGIIHWADNLREVLDSARAYKHEIETHFEVEYSGLNGDWKPLCASIIDGLFIFPTRLAAHEGAKIRPAGPGYRLIEVTRSVAYVSVPISNKDR